MHDCSRWRYGSPHQRYGQARYEFEFLEAKHLLAGDACLDSECADEADNGFVTGDPVVEDVVPYDDAAILREHAHHQPDHGHHEHHHHEPVVCDSIESVCRHDAGVFYIDDTNTNPFELLLPIEDQAPLTGIDSLGRLNQIPLFHSHQSARQKIYLDFDGHHVYDTGWNDLNFNQTIGAPGFDLDGDELTYNAREIQVIEQVWAQVAEDFAPFDLDVTTESPSILSLQAGKEAIRVLISSNVDALSGRTWMPQGSGVAYMNSWWYQNDTPVWVFANKLGGNAKLIAESVSHELGHAFGLRHDGVGEEEYFRGHDSDEVSWAPIMGLGYHQLLTQWSRGEYADADNHEDDIQIIASERNQIRLRQDDHGDSFISATELDTQTQAGFGARQIIATGVVSNSTDRDFFKFEIQPGFVDMTVAGIPGITNLDITATLYNRFGWPIHQLEDSGLTATLRIALDGGTYYLEVDGQGSGDAVSNGYSDYGSLGFYEISASVSATHPTFRSNTSLATLTNQARQHAIEIYWKQQVSQIFNSQIKESPGSESLATLVGGARQRGIESYWKGQLRQLFDSNDSSSPGSELLTALASQARQRATEDYWKEQVRKMFSSAKEELASSKKEPLSLVARIRDSIQNAV